MKGNINSVKKNSKTELVGKYLESEYTNIECGILKSRQVENV